MQILVVDGQGGGIGKLLVSKLKETLPHISVRAVGTNSFATHAMHKAGADLAATGENAIVVGCKNASIIVGPVGIVIADALLGEITPKMAVAIGQSDAKKVLIPTNQCGHVVVGTAASSVTTLISQAIDEIVNIISQES